MRRDLSQKLRNLLVVMDGFREADPNIKQAQAAAHATHESVRQKVLEPGISDEKTVAGPLFAPGEYDQDYAQHRTEENKQQHA
jgi:hypothetical protein